MSSSLWNRPSHISYDNNALANNNQSSAKRARAVSCESTGESRFRLSTSMFYSRRSLSVITNKSGSSPYHDSNSNSNKSSQRNILSIYSGHGAASSSSTTLVGFYSAAKLAPPVAGANVEEYVRSREDGMVMYIIQVHPHNVNLPFLDKMPIPRKTYSIYRQYEDIVGFAEQLEEEFPWLRTSQVSGHPPSSCLRDKSFSPPWLVLKVRSPSPVCNGELGCTQRKESLNRYLTELFSYSPVVTQSRLVAEFFGIWKTDLEFRLNHRDDDPLALHSLFTLPFQTASLRSSTAPVTPPSPVLSDTSMDADSKLSEPFSPGLMSSSVGTIFPSPPSSPGMSATSSRKGSLWCPAETIPFSLPTEALSHKSSFLKLPSPSGSFHDSDDSDDDGEDNESHSDDESDYSDTDSEYDSGSDEYSPHGSHGSESVYERVESIEDSNSLLHPPAVMLRKLRKAASLQNLGGHSPSPIPSRASSPRRERIVVVFPEEHRKPVDDVERNVRNSTGTDSSNAPDRFSPQLAFAEGHRLIQNVSKFVPNPITKHSKHSSLTLSDRPLQTGGKQSHKHPYQDSHRAQTGKTLSVSSIQSLGPSSLPAPLQPWLSRVKCPRSEKRGSLYKFLSSSSKDSVLNIATKASVSTATLVPYKKSPASPVSVSGPNHRTQSPTYDDADEEVRQWTSLIKTTSKSTGERLSGTSAAKRESSLTSSQPSSRPSSPFSRYNFIWSPSSSTIDLARPSGDCAAESPILSVATVPGPLLAGNFSFTFKIILDEETILALQVIEDDPNFVLSVPDLRLRVAKKLTRSRVDVSEAFELVWSAWSGEQVVLKNDGELKRAMQAAQGSRRVTLRCVY